MIIKKCISVFSLIAFLSAGIPLVGQESERLTRAYQVRKCTSELEQLRAEALEELTKLGNIDGRKVDKMSSAVLIDFLDAQVAEARALQEEIQILTDLIING